MKTDRYAVFSLTVALLVLGACGGGETEVAFESERPSAQDSGAMPKSEATLCDHIPQEDVSAAFGGKIMVIGINVADEVNCLYDLGLDAGGPLEGAQLVVHRVQPAMYTSEKERYEGKNLYEALSGVGREAYILNQAQVNALVDDQTAIRLGLMLITMGTEPPLTQEEARSGVIELAGSLVEQL